MNNVCLASMIEDVKEISIESKLFSIKCSIVILVFAFLGGCRLRIAKRYHAVTHRPTADVPLRI